MASVKKAPRRTAERILLASLELFNRFGVPNVSTTMIAADLGISPGNLYYHYPAKEELINGLFKRYESSLGELLPASQGVRDVEDAWFFMHSLFELVWQYRFLYRDLNDLLSNNRLLETHFKTVLLNKSRAMRQLLNGLSSSGAVRIDAREVEATANNMVVVVTYWLSFEYVQNPRQALESGNAQQALLRGAQHALQVLAPFLETSQRQHLLSLSEAYGTETPTP
jgi:AcrR family transcriptional regulator